MPRLELAINVPSMDADGMDHRAVKTVDLWAELTAAQQTTFTAINSRLTTAVLARYGETARLVSTMYVADEA